MPVASLRDLEDFGNVAAEDDAVLEYFVTTDAVSQISDFSKFLVLGRKGSGKTAIVRYFSEGSSGSLSKALNLRTYPWNVHASRVDKGASEIESYVTSWKYLISIELASFLCDRSIKYNDDVESLRQFLAENYGSARPQLEQILRPSKLTISNLRIQPSLFGNAIGGIDLSRAKSDVNFGVELNALTDSIFRSVESAHRVLKMNRIYLHFDELDSGMQELDKQRQAMIIGLVIAARDAKRQFQNSRVDIIPVIYLRTDIWDDMMFSDKNKIEQSTAFKLEWDRDSLLDLVEKRVQAKLGDGIRWKDLIDDDLMRGSQPKFNHIVARTLLRPRDVIQFLNSALRIAKKRSDEPLVFSNRDIVDSRNDYSNYLKRELDDEIVPHWPQWEEALQACSAIATETFQKSEFIENYKKRKGRDNKIEAEEALKLLYNFSVIGYRSTSSGYGGSRWSFLYEEPDTGWDSAATQFKVHPGLKEYARLREKRES